MSHIFLTALEGLHIPRSDNQDDIQRSMGVNNRWSKPESLRYLEAQSSYGMEGGMRMETLRSIVVPQCMDFDAP